MSITNIQSVRDVISKQMIHEHENEKRELDNWIHRLNEATGGKKIVIDNPKEFIEELSKAIHEKDESYE